MLVRVAPRRGGVAAGAILEGSTDRAFRARSPARCVAPHGHAGAAPGGRGTMIVMSLIQNRNPVSRAAPLASRPIWGPCGRSEVDRGRLIGGARFNSLGSLSFSARSSSFWGLSAPLRVRSGRLVRATSSMFCRRQGRAVPQRLFLSFRCCARAARRRPLGHRSASRQAPRSIRQLPSTPSSRPFRPTARGVVRGAGNSRARRATRGRGDGSHPPRPAARKVPAGARQARRYDVRPP